MSDPFESSHRKVARAKKHLKDLRVEIVKFVNGNRYERVIEADLDNPGNTIHKIKLTEELSPDIGDAVADIAQNLRNALDNAAYAVAVASGLTNPKTCAFPFARSATDMASSIGRCKDVPKEIQSLFCGFQPYLGGDDLLWALNEICITDKHKIAVPIGHALMQGPMGLKGTGFFSTPVGGPVWDRAKNEMLFISFGPGAKYKYDFKFQLFVAFNEIQIVDGKPVFAVLNTLCGKVESILMGIEAESKRLKIIK